jgi:hypothetical protein
VVRHASDDRVDGEVGRFEFGLLDGVDEAGELVFAGSRLGPVRPGRQGYPTAGFKAWALLTGATQRSDRQTVGHFNRSRHQEVGGTPLNSLREGTEREGRQVIEFLDRDSGRVLSTHRFDADDRPEPAAPLFGALESFEPARPSEQTLDEAWAAVAHTLRQRGLDEALIEEVKQHSRDADYEPRNETVTIAVDEVGVKEQKAQRVRRSGEASTTRTAPVDPCPEPQASAGNKRPTVQTTVAEIERPGQRFTLTGPRVAQVLRFVLAFLLTKALMVQRLRFFTDGQRSLQGARVTFFSWHPAASLILDGFHWVKKFKEELSLACRGRASRNRHLSRRSRNQTG